MTKTATLIAALALAMSFTGPAMATHHKPCNPMDKACRSGAKPCNPMDKACGVHRPCNPMDKACGGGAKPCNPMDKACHR